MKRLLSAIAAVMLLLGLGAIVVLALPDANTAPAAVAPAAMAAAPNVQGKTNASDAPAAAPDAPAATTGWNAIALPLDMSSSVSTADALKTYIQSFCSVSCPGAVEKVSKWDPVNQIWVTRGTGSFPPNFQIYPGQALLVGIKTGTQISLITMLGDVPPQCPATGCIQYGVSTGLPALVQTGWNFVMLPLDKTRTSQWTADAIKLDIDSTPGKVTKVSKWDATNQIWVTRGTGSFPPNFNISPGYPYLIYANGISATTWPNVWP